MAIMRPRESKLMANSMPWLQFPAFQCDKSLSFNKAWAVSSSTSRQIRKLQSRYTEEFCSPIKKNEIIALVGKWTESGMNRLGETNQPQLASVLSPT